MYSLKQIAQITGFVFSGKADYRVSLFLNDSRALQSAADTLFIALRTSRNDGHQYIDNLVSRGVRSFLVSEAFDRSTVSNPDVSFVVSEDPLKALQALAAHHRTQFSIPVIGITGSNGKTVVKEWLYQLLKQDYTICRSPKSYNSQIGVPLSVLNLNPTHSLAIFEAGISKPGEMETLQNIIQPTLGVLTSIGSAHDEGFESREQKIAEKLKLFSGCEKVVIHGLNKKDLAPDLLKKALLVSEREDADLRLAWNGEILKLSYLTEAHSSKIPFSDAASAYNASTCAAVLLQLGRHLPDIAGRLEKLQPVALRLEIKTGIQNSLLINDYYNSDLDSVKIALSYLQQQNRRGRKIVIVSDIEQSGISSAVLYRQLAELFALNKVDLLVGIGQEISRHKPLFKANSLFFNDTANFISQFRNISYQFSDASILLKGARSFGFENISR